MRYRMSHNRSTWTTRRVCVELRFGACLLQRRQTSRQRFWQFHLDFRDIRLSPLRVRGIGDLDVEARAVCFAGLRAGRDRELRLELQRRAVGGLVVA